MARRPLGLDGGIGTSWLEATEVAIEQAVETDSAQEFSASIESPEAQRFGVDGNLTFGGERNFSGKPQTIQTAVETDTAQDLIDFSVRAQTIGQAVETDTANNLTFTLSLAITSVSSSRGTNIVTANELLTINVTDSTGITAVTVNGAACSLVQIITPTEINCVVPLGVGAQYFTSVDVVADNGAPCPAFSASWRPPLGMVETDFTVAYAGLDPDSPFAGDPAFSALDVGDSCIYDALTTPDSLGVSMDGLGEFTITGTITQVQTVDYYIYDLSDNTVSPTIEQITVQPGPVEAEIGQAAETDSAHDFTATVAVTGTIEIAIEPNLGLDLKDGSSPAQEIEQAVETNSAFDVSVGSPIQNIFIGQAVEADSAFNLLDGSVSTGLIETAVETDTAFDLIDAAAVSFLIDQAVENDTAFTLTPTPSLLDLGQQITALTDLVIAQQVLIDEMHTRLDLDAAVQNTYADDASDITNTLWSLTKASNGDGTFDISRGPPPVIPDQ